MTWNIKNRNFIFFVLQFLGWGAFFLLVFISLNASGGIFARLLLYISLVLVGVIPTTLLRFYLKLTKSIARFSWWNVLKVIIGIMTASWIFITIPYYLGIASRWLTERIAPEDPLDVSNTMGFTSDTSRFIFSLILMAAWTSAYLGVQYFFRLNNQRAERIVLKDSIKKAQLNTLKGHLNPNFIIQVLSAIRTTMDTDVKLARRMLTELSEILRYSLTKNDVHQVFINEELRMVDRYALLLNKVTASDVLFKKDFTKETLGLEIPPMLLLNLCEMVAENEDFRQAGTNEFGLAGSLVKETLTLTLSCPKFSLARPDDVMESRIKQRLKLLFKEEGGYTKSFDGGLSVQLTLPVAPKALKPQLL
ncbi:Signal transduction histidine kinase, LytS [Croceitalea dokdonensis DOKDO 023]|uniref:Signal transduction histidine kinase, LytS n=1 Tax=Croceitalea dokdonensis DOKDO 023 TaxID=1300341 RepID=A0A0P7AWM9_9FLAO|nr:sensor histidine kinase [Croceitalea dokdonensis]KPM32504.1 Signal transduction histidine kinase, LytS [Croceitalea dokdonensis DOKDO 023]